jgi:hypothetical protein
MRSRQVGDEKSEDEMAEIDGCFAITAVST